MNTKFTLRLDEKLIASTKRHSAESGRPLSQLVADFLFLIEAQSADVEITSRAGALRGVLAASGLDEGEYRRHLERRSPGKMTPLPPDCFHWGWLESWIHFVKAVSMISISARTMAAIPIADLLQLPRDERLALKWPCGTASITRAAVSFFP
jgi:hypothetical protein